MKLKKGFVLREVCGNPVVMAEGVANIDFNRLLALSESATWLWQEAQRQGDFTIASLAEALCEEYDITPDIANRDVTRLVEQLQNEDVVE